MGEMIRKTILLKNLLLKANNIFEKNDTGQDTIFL
jgi:hypothetical protein